MPLVKCNSDINGRMKLATYRSEHVPKNMWTHVFQPLSQIWTRPFNRGVLFFIFRLGGLTHNSTLKAGTLVEQEGDRKNPAQWQHGQLTVSGVEGTVDVVKSQGDLKAESNGL